MRYVVALLLVALAASPAAARRHRHAHNRPRPAKVRHIVPNDQQARDYARAEAELADLRNGRAEPAANPDPPDIAGVQENDAERPALPSRR